MQILEKAEWSTRRHADEPKYNGQFLTAVTEMKPLLFLLYIMLNKFGYLAHTQLCSSVQTVFQVLHGFLSPEDVLGHLLQIYAQHHSPQFRCDLATSSHSFPTSVIEWLT
jgi:hypothetical protein